MNGKCFVLQVIASKLMGRICYNKYEQNCTLSSPQVFSCLRAVICLYPAAQMKGHCRAQSAPRSVGSEFSWRCRHFGSSLTSWAQR